MRTWKVIRKVHVEGKMDPVDKAEAVTADICELSGWGVKFLRCSSPGIVVAAFSDYDSIKLVDESCCENGKDVK